MKGLLCELALQYAGRPGVAMGGGESLPAQLARCPDNAVYVSANQHGALLRTVDFIVSIDGNEADVRPCGVPVIGRRVWCDYRIQDWQDFHYCGPTVAWVLRALGCHPVILTGMDCYQGGTYHHDPQARSTGRLVTLEEHTRHWRDLEPHMRGIVVRSCGGPTAEVFPLWDPDEALPEYAPPTDALAMQAMKPRKVRTNDCARINGKPVDAGHELLVSPTEFEYLMRRRTAVALE